MIKAGVIVGIGGRDNEDTTPDVPTDGTTQPDTMDESKRPGSDLKAKKSKFICV